MTEANNVTRHFALEKDKYVPEEETISTEELTRDLMEAFAESLAYERGEVPHRVTEWIDGKPVTYWCYKDGPAVDRYRVVIEWNRQATVFTAELPELPGCRAEGRTQEEALANVRTAANVWLDTAVKEGRPIPPPKSLSAAA